MNAKQTFKVWLAGLGVALAGCGGGGSKDGNVAGVVTDPDGQAVAGARVSVAGRAATSLSNGTFTVRNVRSGYQTVTAVIDINGRRWSGETVADFVPAHQNRNVNVVVSDERFQGAIAGTVIDPSGFPLEGAKVFADQPPLGSTMAVTDRFGNYTLRRLAPGINYNVTCSLKGFVNETKRVLVQANTTMAASFALALGSYQGTIPAPQNVRSQAWTISSDISRKAGGSVYDWLKRRYRKKFGFPDVSQARNIEWKSKGRATPLGSVVEIDLYWDFKSYDDLFGYAIRRGTLSGNLSDVAVVRDPLTSAFFDVDTALTPDTRYYYTVHGLETVRFPENGTVGPASAETSANPLRPIFGLSPGQGSLPPPGAVLFTWSGALGVDNYTVYVWDKFPDLQNANDPEGVTPYWTSNLVPHPTTQAVYNGPALVSGRAYYWMVVGEEAGGSALTATEIRKFVAR